MDTTAQRQTAIQAVLAASRLCRAVQAAIGEDTTLSKQDRSPVTVADFGVQAVISHFLGEAFPDISLVGEEDSAQLRQPENSDLRGRVHDAVTRILPQISAGQMLDDIDRGSYPGGAEGMHWTLDPIDGTKGFLRRDQYAVALALIEEGRVVLGVLSCPNLPHDSDRPGASHGGLFVAAAGGGAAWCPLDGDQEQPIRVSPVGTPARARFCESVEKAHSSQSDAAKVAARLGIEAPPLRIDSQCKYATVARGDASVYLRLPTRADYVEKIRDYAAGSIVIEEAGGRVTDIHGEHLDFSIGRQLERNEGVIATNGLLHDVVLAAVGEVLG